MRVLAGAMAVVLWMLPVMGNAAGHLPDLAGREIRIATDNFFPPLQYNDTASGMPVGLEYDLMAELAKRLNFAPRYEVTAWDGMIDAVSAGRFDMAMAGITLRPERVAVVDVSEPYMTLGMAMMVRGDERRFTDAASFAARPEVSLGAVPGTTSYYVGVFDVLTGDEASPRVKTYPKFKQATQALRDGTVDLVMAEPATARAFVLASDGGLKIIGELVRPETLGFVFPKGSDLVAPINAALADLQADGTLERLILAWFLDLTLEE